jgi:hypothetical protein
LARFAHARSLRIQARDIKTRHQTREARAS